MHHRLQRRIFVFCAFCAMYPSPASASYGNMHLNLATFFSLALIGAYTILVDVALLLKLFRSMICVGFSSIVSMILITVLIVTWDDPRFFSSIGSWGIFSLTLPPFILFAPLVQYQTLNRYSRSARAKYFGTVGMNLVIALQVAAPVAFLTFDAAYMANYGHRMDNLRAQGNQAKPGEVKEILRQQTMGTSEAGQVLQGLNSSSLVGASAPLTSSDRDALFAAVAETVHHGYARYPHIETKLVWDTLDAGHVGDRLAQGTLADLFLTGRNGPDVSFRLLPDLVAYIEKDASRRLCPGGRMLEEDRAALDSLYANGEENAKAAQATMQRDYGPNYRRPDQVDEVELWRSFRQRVANVCGS
jgi:hypothetical protein